MEIVLPEDLHTTVHLTLSPGNIESVDALFERLAGMGANALSLSATSPELEEVLQNKAELATDMGLSLVWDVAVPYSASNPIALETVEDDPPQGAGRAWLYVEPDGDVLPTQGVNQVLGNLLQDDWDSILNK